MRGARVAALLSGLTAAVTLAACGIPPSDVIEAGEPANGMFSPTAHPSAPTTVTLYFLHDGELTAYPRRSGTPGDLGSVLRLLFEGPTANEAATATTQLPRLAGTPRVATEGDGTLSVQLPGEAAPLSRQAVLQLACTVTQAAQPSGTAVPHTNTEAGAGAAHRTAGHSALRVLGDGWTMTPSDYACPPAGLPQERDEGQGRNTPEG
ncbi:hypothetical protein ACFV3R_21315 [Streptomyces sp. NPDC059740]|uniref:hypothetical protein n=1 Tax=Streptomyces sp. NPDC059740 TaxID=3346926 RepID=UPI0036657AD8